MTNITSDKGDTFQELTLLSNVDLIDRACIYTIWTLTAISYRYDLLYIGQTGQAQTRINKNHHKYQCWQNNNINGLYVAFLITPSEEYTETQRKQLEADLINKYNPPCNS